MPRTRNVTRSQWDAANAIHDAKAKENGHDSEKENASRAPRSTRSRTAGRTVLGMVSTAASRNIVSKSKGKGKPSVKGSLIKAEKLPLQDITSRYLPAPEPENRGYAQPMGFGPPENLVLSPSMAGPSNSLSMRLGGGDVRTTTRRVFPSSLPPSSPPSISSVPAPSQPQLPVLSRSPSPIVDPLARRLFNEPSEAPAYDAWREFDFVVPESDGPSRPRATPRNSDPFGFFALERKLKAEREEGQDEDETAGIVLVKETSPTPDEPSTNDNSDSFHLPPTPPTPHKTAVKARRDSYISSQGSSCSSSPSPSKPQRSASKRKVEADADALHDEVDDGTPHVRKLPGRKPAKRTKQVNEEPVLRRSTRGQKNRVQEDDNAEPQPGPSRKPRSTKSTTKRTRSTAKETKSKKAAILPPDDSDAEEKREQERQARISYFRELEEYKVETENVYVI